MKTFSVKMMAGLLIVTAAGAQTSLWADPATSLPAPTPWVVVERGADHNVWERTVYEPGPNGAVVGQLHRYTELATGLNYRDRQSGQWRPSREEIDLLPAGGAYAAAAVAGEHQVYFPGDIYSGVMTLVTPEGRELSSRPVGLFYEDDSNSVLIAVLTNSVGERVGSNQVIYPQAFEGAEASIRYTYTKAGLEQDILVQAQLPAPESYGLDPARTRLEVLTEFLDTNRPVETTAAVNPPDGLSDVTLTFGKMKMTRGRAFLIGKTSGSPGGGAGRGQGATPTCKRWLNLKGRHFLLEEVPYSKVAPQLDQLPPATGRVKRVQTNLLAGNSILNKVSPRRLLPPARRVQASAWRKMQLAQTDLSPKRSFVLDYVTLNSSLTNYVFQGDTTYYLTGPVIISGTTTLEGGAVIKFAPGAGAKLSVDQLICRTGPYRPAVLTARDDNTVGETISGSTGVPSGFYASRALEVNNTAGAGTTVTNLRIAYAATAFYDLGEYDPYQTDSARDVQMIRCGTGFYLDGDAGQNLSVANSLLWGMGRAFAGYGWDYYGSWGVNATVDGCTNLAADDRGTGGSLFLTNCILANVTQLSGDMTVGGSDNGFYQSATFGDQPVVVSTSPFQSVGAGSHYLAPDSPFRNAGTTNVEADLLRELGQKTTYPPIVYSNTTLSIATTFSPQAQRDTDTPDLGYHYDPLDYCFGGVRAYSNLTFTAGTAMGWFELPGSGGPGYGISIYDRVTAAFNGTATEPCLIARYSTVQEGGNGLWKDKGWLAAVAGQSLSGGYGMNPTNAPWVQATFLHAASLSWDPNVFREYYALFGVSANHCEFWSHAFGGYQGYYTFTNCLFDRGATGISGSSYSLFSMRNCTLRGGNISINRSGSTWPMWIENCAFDGTTFNVDDPVRGNTNVTYDDYNAYLQGAAQLPEAGPHTVTVWAYNWQSSWFGNYYLPAGSPLVDAGSTTADQVGLYHFTTQADQTVEGTSIVDIAYHYVATDIYGNPLDTDGDGVPDYLEDANGNGIYDVGDLGDWLVSRYNGLSRTNGLSVFTPLKE
jgi:hypothetical protein